MNLEITLQQGSYVSFRSVVTGTLPALWKYFRKNFSDDLIIIKHKLNILEIISVFSEHYKLTTF